MSIEVMRVPVISTGHLTQETRDMLTLEQVNVPSFVGNYGWILYVGEYAKSEDLPEDLTAAMKWANDNGFEWLRFDSDGPYTDGLAQYE